MSILLRNILVAAVTALVIPMAGLATPPTIEAVEGDRVRILVTNKLP